MEGGMTERRRIVITGMSVVSCLGNDPDLFYRRLLQGESGIRGIDEFPCEEYSTRFGGTVKDFDPGDLIDKKQARRVDPCIAYAIWAGVGIVLISIVGIFAFKQIPDLPAIIGMLLIIAGVVVINLFSKTSAH